jgi:hypothetical protein
VVCVRGALARLEVRALGRLVGVLAGVHRRKAERT